MNRKNLRMVKRIEIRNRLNAGETPQQLIKVFPFMQPRKLALRAQS